MGTQDRTSNNPSGRAGLGTSLPKRKSIPLVLRRLTSVGFAGVLVLLTLELAMRHYAYIPRRLDPDFGYVATGQAWWFREGGGIGHWGARGVRVSSSPTNVVEKTILVLGDSFTEAPHVSDDEVYTDVLERSLRRASHNLRVLNAGVTGSTLPYYVHLAPSYLRAFSPSWTVVQINPDDVLGAAFSRKATHFERLPDGSVRVRALPPEGGGGLARRALRFLQGHSALLQNSVLQYKAFADSAKSFRPFRQTEALPPARTEDPNRFPIAEELAALSNAFGGRVTILFVSPWQDGIGSDEPSPVERSVDAGCRALGASCVFSRTVYPQLARSAAFPTGFPNTRPGRGHLNPTGHAAVAEALGRELLAGKPSALF